MTRPSPREPSTVVPPTPSPADRARLSLEGLSTGDAFGECFFTAPPLDAHSMATTRHTPDAPLWPVTDDTLMAIALVETLLTVGTLDPPALARAFARTHHPSRGFGPAMDALLPALGRSAGQDWAPRAAALFAGRGSLGNGAAMRVAPLGAFFADDLDQLQHEAAHSAAVTHSHPEAAAGAIATALAAALSWRSRTDPVDPQTFLTTIARRLPPSLVRDGIDRAIDLPTETDPLAAAALLGNGSRMSCPDTVPFALWSAATSLDSYEDALWRTVAAAGDTDTTGAIVGGIVVLRTGLPGIPPAWLRRREPLTAWLAPPTPDTRTR